MSNAPLIPAPSTRRAAVLVAVLALVLAACGADTGAQEPTVTATPGSPAATSPAATTPAPTDGPTTAPASEAGPSPFPANTEDDRGEASGAVVAVTDVTVGSHDGYDRVVLAIEGDGQAGWHARYVDEARSQGSGSEVAVEGGAVLEVVVTNTSYPMDAPATPFQQERVDTGGLTTIQAVVNDAIFEGRHLFFVGVDERTPFRVFRLEDPQRIVLDVQHP